MAITVIGGLAVSTLLTLVVIPVVYERVDRKADAYYVERAARKASRHTAGDDAASVMAEAHS
jgi:HAE1 family hydrophobic/amphiphilic exporter-1